MTDRLQAIIDRQRAFDAAHDWDMMKTSQMKSS